MGRYFFHVTGKFPVEDTEGEEFPTPEAAAEEARETAWELARNRSSVEIQGTLRVTDETGLEIATFPIF
jgi:uncharacterized protein DUF6894